MEKRQFRFSVRFAHLRKERFERSEHLLRARNGVADNGRASALGKKARKVLPRNFVERDSAKAENPACASAGLNCAGPGSAGAHPANARIRRGGWKLRRCAEPGQVFSQQLITPRGGKSRRQKYYGGSAGCEPF